MAQLGTCHPCGSDCKLIYTRVVRFAVVTAMHSELTTNDGKIVAWTPIGPVAGGSCGQFQQKIVVESILTATTAHITIFDAAGHSKAVHAQHLCRTMVVAACKLPGRDEEAALKAVAEMPKGVLEAHTAAHLQNVEESTCWNAEGTAPNQNPLWNIESTAPGRRRSCGTQRVPLQVRMSSGM